MNQVDIYLGDCQATLASLPDCSVQCCVTSPPYWGLRDYGRPGQFGLEADPAEYVAQMAAVFREVQRVLRSDGTLWLNLGDSYDSSKQLVGIPWRVAFALQSDGWYLRQDIIWSKPNPMPESVRDRCTKAHEYVFLLTKRPRYYFDADAIAQPATPSTVARVSQPTWGEQAGSTRVPGKTNGNMKAVVRRSGNAARKSAAQRGVPADANGKTRSDLAGSIPWQGATSNRRSVWRITTKPFKDAHFAVMPTELADLCIRAGSRLDDTILDPFGGAGTTALAAQRLQRNAILCELNPDYAMMAQRRITADNRLFCQVTLHSTPSAAQNPAPPSTA